MVRYLGLVVLSFTAWGDEDSGWTDSLRSPEGLFAFRADTAQKRLLLFRADKRNVAVRSYRIALRHGTRSSLVVPLHRAGGDGPPWKFGAEVPGWDGTDTEADLEASDDGKHWFTVGKFSRP